MSRPSLRRAEARAILARMARRLRPWAERAQAKRVLLAAYPWGVRRGWPYQVWLDEAHRQVYGPVRPARDTRQGELFDWAPNGRAATRITRGPTVVLRPHGQ